MAQEKAAPDSARAARLPPYSEEAERGVLGCVLLDADRLIDLCIEAQLSADSFYVPAHRIVFETILDLHGRAGAIDILTVSERLKSIGQLEKIGGAVFLDRIVDATPTSAHAEYYIDIVRQKSLLRSIIAGARTAEMRCYDSDQPADEILSDIEQSFLDITENQHGSMKPWPDAVKETVEHIEQIFKTQRGVTGLPTGFQNLDRVLLGLRPSEMVVIAARPSMGKTSLAMNIAENIAIGLGSDRTPHPVGVFSLEMSADALVFRMLCCRAEVNSFQLSSGYVTTAAAHNRLISAASELQKARIYLDDTGGLDIMEVRARARRMRKKHGIELLVVDYLQLLQSREYARQGRQVETANISNNLKAMAKELRIPVVVLSQLSRAPDQREKTGKPKLSDLRDSGAIEQDADVVCLLRRPCKYPEDEHSSDKMLAIVDVAKQRNGPTGEVKLNFEEEFTRFRDRTEKGVDGIGPSFGAEEDVVEEDMQ
ncbi:MAG: replicative DNA helicase [Lentisphaerae bacterium]|nr:replicative DNA helicase [Lentisphaerota bacterium]